MILWSDDEPGRGMTPDGMKVFADLDEAKLPKDVPTGTYTAKLRSWKAVPSMAGKQPYVRFSLSIVAGDFASVQLIYKAYLSEACWQRTKILCGQLEIKTSDGEGSLPSQPQCMIQVENRGGYAEVRSIKVLPPGTPAEPSVALPEVNPPSDCDAELNEDADGIPGAL